MILLRYFFLSIFCAIFLQEQQALCIGLEVVVPEPYIWRNSEEDYTVGTPIRKIDAWRKSTAQIDSVPNNLLIKIAIDPDKTIESLTLQIKTFHNPRKERTFKHLEKWTFDCKTKKTIKEIGEENPYFILQHDYFEQEDTLDYEEQDFLNNIDFKMLPLLRYRNYALGKVGDKIEIEVKARCADGSEEFASAQFNVATKQNPRNKNRPRKAQTQTSNKRVRDDGDFLLNIEDKKALEVLHHLIEGKKPKHERRNTITLPQIAPATYSNFSNPSDSDLFERLFKNLYF